MKKNGSYKNKLFDILNNESFTSEFISGIAGDRIWIPLKKSCTKSFWLNQAGIYM